MFRWVECTVNDAMDPNAIGTLNQLRVASKIVAMDLRVIVLILTLSNHGVCDHNHRYEYSGCILRGNIVAIGGRANLLCSCFFAFYSPIMAHGYHTQAARSVRLHLAFRDRAWLFALF